MSKILLINGCAECPNVDRCKVLGTRSQRLAFFIGVGMPDLHPKCPLPEAPQNIIETGDTAYNTGSPKFSPCGNCSSESTTEILVANGYNFCPRCGRKLRASA